MRTHKDRSTGSQQAPKAQLPHDVSAFIACETADAVENVSTALGMITGTRIVETATDGALVFQVVQRLKPNLILLSLDLPGVNGFEAATQIKLLHPSARVLIIAHCDDAELGLAALECGADGFLSKKNLRRQLRWHISRLFSDKPQHCSAGTRMRSRQ